MTSNPFSTRFIRPGALPYLFPPGESAESLISKLRANNWHGQIIGPHGSGKSTLLATLIPALESAGRTVIHCRLSNVESRTSTADVNSTTFDFRPSTFDISTFQLDATTQLILDGYEQLSWLTRRRIQARCKEQGAGLLVTAHRDIGIPTLCQTQPTQDLAKAVVKQLLPTADNSITESDIEQAYAATAGNIRETLFKLYDAYRDRCIGLAEKRSD